MDLLAGFQTIVEPTYIFWILIGVLAGTMIGALPGIGSVTGTAILLPFVFGMDPISALVLLVGIYQGTSYGGRISSILVNVPGDGGAVVSTFDGYPMTKQGKAGYALALSAISSFIGGMIGLLGLTFLTTVVVQFAMSFGPPEYFALMLFALIAASGFTDRKPFKAIVSSVLGLMVAAVGLNKVTGTPRLTFDILYLWDGINFVVVAIGVFGLSEVLMRLENKDSIKINKTKIPLSDLFPKIKDLRNNFWAMIRGSFIGFIIGVLPGAGGTIATFISYSMEKKVSKNPEKFGTGVPQGLSGPEAANNSVIGGSLIPLFSLGIPGSGTTAIILGALLMIGLEPGPLMLERSGNLIWATIASLFIANFLLLGLNTIFVPFFATLIQKADKYLTPVIVVLCFVGIYVLKNSMFDVGLMILFGFIGYIMRKTGFPLAPLVLAVILAPMIEKSFMQSLMMSGNSLSIFFTRPISILFIALSIAILVYPFMRSRLERKRQDSEMHL
jgi:putative tricarboxylic transport membrane protein